MTLQSFENLVASNVRNPVYRKQHLLYMWWCVGSHWTLVENMMSSTHECNPSNGSGYLAGRSTARHRERSDITAIRGHDYSSRHPTVKPTGNQLHENPRKTFTKEKIRTTQGHVTLESHS